MNIVAFCIFVMFSSAVMANPFYDSFTSGGGGTGDVNGPASSSTNAAAKFCNTTGKTLCNTGVFIDSSNSILMGTQLTLSGGVSANYLSSIGLVPFVIHAGSDPGTNARIELSSIGLGLETISHFARTHVFYDEFLFPTMTIANNIATIANVEIGTLFQIGSSIPLSDSSGTLTLQNVDVIDATTESTIESAIDTLSNLTSIQGNTITVSGASTINQNVSTTGTPSFTRVTSTTTITAGIVDNGNATGASPTVNIDLSAGLYQFTDLATATGTVSISLNNEVNGQSYVIRITQGSSTPLVSFTGGTFLWANGSTYIATAVDNAVDVVTCEYMNSIFYCSWGGNYS